MTPEQRHSMAYLQTKVDAALVFEELVRLYADPVTRTKPIDGVTCVTLSRQDVMDALARGIVSIAGLPVQVRVDRRLQQLLRLPKEEFGTADITDLLNIAYLASEKLKKIGAPFDRESPVTFNK